MSAQRERDAGGDVDWNLIRARVEDLGRVVAGEASRSREEVEQVLAERARALAAQPPGAAAEESSEWVLFELGGESYGIESSLVIEIFRKEEVALLPGASPPVLGLSVWRGEILYLLELRQILGRAGTRVPDAAQILVVGEARAAFGIPVESTTGLRRLATAEILSSEARPAGPVRGVTADGVVVLDGTELIRTHS